MKPNKNKRRTIFLFASHWVPEGRTRSHVDFVHDGFWDPTRCDWTGGMPVLLQDPSTFGTLPTSFFSDSVPQEARKRLGCGFAPRGVAEAFAGLPFFPIPARRVRTPRGSKGLVDAWAPKKKPHRAEVFGFVSAKPKKWYSERKRHPFLAQIGRFS